MAERVPTRLERSTLRVVLLNLVLLGGSLLVALVLAEGTVRTFYPVMDGRSNVTLDGTPIRDWFPASTVYRQVSNEYDAATTITEKRHRVPGADNPAVVFIGDSFTYGYGLKDEETFPSIYCQQLRVACANLGIPGSGTSREVERLGQFIDTWQWRPKHVKLFFFGMSSSFGAGNDFVDNYNYGRWLTEKTTNGGVVEREKVIEREKIGFAARVIGWQSALLEHSHLMRRAKFHWGPLLKSLIINPPVEAQMAEALRYTENGLQELDALGRRVGFDYTIYLIVPVQDIIRGSHDQTLAALNGVSPRRVVATAPLFVDRPQDYYFAYDGHLNPAGSKRLADFLVSTDRETPPDSFVHLRSGVHSDAY
jgi:hypothetical protein